MNSAQIKAVDWQLLLNRRASLLFQSLAGNAGWDFPRLTGIPWRASAAMHCSSGEIFYRGRDLNALRETFQSGGLSVLRQLRRRLLFHLGRLDRLARSIERINCVQLRRRQLVSLIARYFGQALALHAFLMPMPVADRVLSASILASLPPAADQQRQAWLGTLTFPAQENELVREERSFLGIASAYAKRSNHLRRMIAGHLRRFQWIGTRWYWFSQAWTSTDIEARVRGLFDDGKNPAVELRHLETIRRVQTEDRRRLLRQLKIRRSSQLYAVIALAREYAFLRTYRTDVLYRGGFLVHGLFAEAARRAGFHPADVVYLAYQEIATMAKTGQPPLTPQELRRRQQYCVSVRVGQEYAVLSGAAWAERLGPLLVRTYQRAQTVSGSTAFPGRARGKVRVVFSSGDLSQVGRGDVLVAVMTFPHFIAAMERAAAFVTDEGGILCHAAIVAREMKKPCIVGTEVATQVLKDGDVVAVDATRGVVKVLKRA